MFLTTVWFDSNVFLMLGQASNSDCVGLYCRTTRARPYGLSLNQLVRFLCTRYVRPSRLMRFVFVSSYRVKPTICEERPLCDILCSCILDVDRSSCIVLNRSRSRTLFELICWARFPLTEDPARLIFCHLAELMFHSANVKPGTSFQRRVLTTGNFLQTVGIAVAMSDLACAASSIVKEQPFLLRRGHFFPPISLRARQREYPVSHVHFQLGVLKSSRQNVHVSDAQRDVVRRVVYRHFELEPHPSALRSGEIDVIFEDVKHFHVVLVFLDVRVCYNATQHCKVERNGTLIIMGDQFVLGQLRFWLRSVLVWNAVFVLNRNVTLTYRIIIRIMIPW